MDNFHNYKDIVLYFQDSDQEVIRKLQNENIIKTVWRCRNRNCRRMCRLRHNDDYYLNFSFFCPNCNQRYPVTSGSFFEDMRISAEKIFFTMWLWCTLTPATSAQQIVGLPKAAILQLYRYFRDIASWKLLQTPEMFQFGGPGQVVQVDESVVTRRKYNVGRVPRQQWVLGIYDCTLRRGLVLFVPNRNRQTLFNQITNHVRPGSEVWTDCWGGYRGLGNIGGVPQYIHRTVNHTQNFVDPITGVCTNGVEGYWSKLKRFCRKLGVMQSQLLAEHIDHFMWYEIYSGNSANETFVNLLTHKKERYPV